MKATRVSLGLGLVLLCGPALAQPAHGRAPELKPKTYGLSQVSYYRIPASEFSPLDTSFPYTDLFVQAPTGMLQRYGNGYPSMFVASPHLPSGALVTYFELDSCDEDPTLDVVATLYLCDYHGGCTGVGGAASSNNAVECGFASEDVSSAGIQVDNFQNQVSIVIVTESGDVTNRFSGVILGYQLQVSSPPVSPDFTDVPASSPQYQFIEALYNSGITAGCGGGNYCPNNPLTRGQMAVFLAKALGLQWQ